MQKNLHQISAALLIALSHPIATAASQAPAEANFIPKTVQCPETKQLQRNPKTQTWSAVNGQFKSYDPSLANGVAAFIGAQWVGAQLGQITCLYSVTPKTNFPILLAYHTLALTPSGGAWKQGTGSINCVSANQNTCRFIVRIHKQENIYQEAADAKFVPQLQPPAG